MEEAIKFQMLVRKIKFISNEGLARLSKQARLNFMQETYTPLKKVILDTSKFCDKPSLAYFLIFNFGAGTYDALRWENRRLKRGQLFHVVLTGTMESRWGFHYVHAKGISKFGWFFT